MQEVAELPVLNHRGVPIIGAAVNGTPVAFVVDSGSGLSAIGPAAASRLQLHPTGSTHFQVAGVTGDARAAVLTVDELTLGATKARNVTFAELGPFGSRPNPASPGKRELVGLFGADFLSGYDVEFDLPDRRIGLYTEQGRCGRDFDPWDGPVNGVPFRLDATGHAVLGVHLDGHDVEMVLDSGASVPIVDPETAGDIGVSKAMLDADRVVKIEGIDGTTEPVRVHSFDRLDVGGNVTAPFVAGIGDTSEMLLGAPWLRTHRVWVSYPHDEILIAQ